MDKVDSHHVDLLFDPVANHTMMKLEYLMLINKKDAVS